MEERFEVLSGHPSFLAGSKWQTARPGDTVVFRRRAARLSNRGDEVAHVVCHARPPVVAAALPPRMLRRSRAPASTRQGLPKTPSALLKPWS
jgi:uncharacterized cupin superfamily protein